MSSLKISLYGTSNTGQVTSTGTAKYTPFTSLTGLPTDTDMLPVTWLALAGMATLASAAMVVAVASVVVLSNDLRRSAVTNLDISASFEI
jgi:hypothetical protein